MNMGIRKKLKPLNDQEVHLLLVTLEQRKIAQQVEDDADVLQDHYSPDAGAIESFVRRKRSEARTKNAVQQSAEISAAAKLRSKINDAKVDILASAHALEHAPEKLDELRERERVVNENIIETNKEATARKTDTLTLNLLIQEEHRTNQAIKLKEAESTIGIADYSERARIDVQKDFDIRINQLKAVLALKTFPYLKLAEIRQYIKGLLLEDAEVAESELPAQVKAEYRMLLQDTIVVYRRTYERGLGLLQVADGEDVGGTDSFAQLGSGVEGTDKEGDEQV
jgi:hypothetical protein